MQFGFRVDGGQTIGYGHLSRSAALAAEIQADGHTVTVATTTPKPVEAVFPDATSVVGLSSRDDPEPFVDWLDTAGPDVVFTDAYPVGTAYQRAVRDRVPLVVLQDDAQHSICADLFINGNLYATALNYDFVGDPPETCLGTKYVLLQREIRNRAAEEPPWRERPEHAIVMMGGSDIGGLTPTVVRAFDGLNLRVDAIVGPGCSAELERDVRRAATEPSAAVSVRRDPDTLVALMTNADIAVSTASTTTYELLGLGTPMVAVPVVPNQEPIAAALRNRDVGTVLQPETSEDGFREVIRDAVNSPGLRRERRDQGRELVDCNGVERVAAELYRIAEEPGS